MANLFALTATHRPSTVRTSDARAIVMFLVGHQLAMIRPTFGKWTRSLFHGNGFLFDSEDSELSLGSRLSVLRPAGELDRTSCDSSTLLRPSRMC